MSKTTNILLGALMGLAAAASAAAVDKPTVIGILPVYDDSAKSLTDSLTPNLTYMIYRDLLSNPALQPVLLSPGGLYDPDATDWISEYAAKAKVDVVLISEILPCLKVNNRHSRIQFQVRLLTLSDGSLSTKALNDTLEVANDDLFSYVETTYVSSTLAGFYKGPKDFEKHALGKAALKLAEWTKGYIATALSVPDVPLTGDDPGLNPATCGLDFHISYVKKRSISKSYTVIVNNMDQSSTINDGRAHFSMPSGPLSLRIQVNDAPYGVPIEKLYQASTILDCSSSSHNLVFEMGNAGDSLLNWQ
jgi:hypothetical protein